MIFIFGLGNPGKEYENTRHSIGQWVVRQWAEEIKNEKLKVKKDLNSSLTKLGNMIFANLETYMNESGRAVRAVIDYYDSSLLTEPKALETVFVIHDDLDLELGSFKIQLGIGPKQHNGLESVYKHLGRKDFWHVRVGVDNRQGDRSIPGKNYVLSKFSGTELETLQAVSRQIIAAIEEKL